MTKRLLRFCFLTLLTFSILGCNSQTIQKDVFKFEYLKSSNKKIKDSSKLKLNLYFNNYPINRVNNYLANIEDYKEAKKDNRTDNFMKVLNAVDNGTYTPDRLKRIKINDKYVIDSLFYEQFEIPQIIFIAENYYDQIENLRLTRLEYDKNINSIIKFQYDFELPITYNQDNVLSFNVDFRNKSSKDIKSFEGKLIVSNSENLELLKLNLNSNVFPQNIYPNPLNSVDLDNWEWSVLNEYRGSLLGLQIQVSEYKREQIYDNRKKLILTFIPTAIYFKDGTTLYQN